MTPSPTTTANSGPPSPITTTESLVDNVPVRRIYLGALNVCCHGCGTYSDMVDIGTNPQLVDDELLMFGVVHFPACGHIAYCVHLARRCGQILEHLERQVLLPEDFCGLVSADHEPDET